MISRSDSRLRLILVILFLHLGVTGALIGWWRHVMLQQSDRMWMLESKVAASSFMPRWRLEKTRRMVNWESIWLVGVICASGGCLAWLYWRDLKRSRALQIFFSSLTHELKTPLTSIRLQAESLADQEGEEHGAVRPMIKRLLEDTGRLQEMVERTLELARLEQGPRLMTEELDVSPLLDRVIKSWIADHPGRVSVEHVPSDATFMANAQAVQTIMTNLLDNSISHGGKQCTCINCCVEVTDEKVRVQYRDNGAPNLDAPRNPGRLFEKGARSRGAGVGLYLVRMLMSQMGGAADYRLQEGFAATLTFRPGRSDG